MYSVVGCGECSALWIVADRPETTGCPRCGTRHRLDRLRRLAETEDEATARAARARLLAERSGHADDFADLGGPEELEARAEAAVVADEEYLAGSGLDVEAVEAAAEAAGRGAGSHSVARRDVVLTALRTLDPATEDAVVAYAAERGVPERAASALLERLVRTGAARRDGDGFQLV